MESGAQHHRAQLKKLITVVADPRLERFAEVYQQSLKTLVESLAGSGDLLREHYRALEDDVFHKSPFLSLGAYASDDGWFEGRDAILLWNMSLLEHKRQQLRAFMTA